MLALALLASVLGAEVPAEDVPRLLVMDVEARGTSADDAAHATQRLVTTLTASRRFSVISGDDVRRALSLEAERQEAGCTDTSCLDEIAGALGASYIVFGTLTASGGRQTLSVTLFRTETMEAIARTQEDVPKRARLDDAAVTSATAMVRGWDAWRGAFPASTAAVFGGGALTAVGLVAGGVGVWQLIARSGVALKLDRLEDDYEDTRDPDLADEAADAREQLIGHTGIAVGAFIVAAALVIGGGALAAAGAVGAFE